MTIEQKVLLQTHELVAGYRKKQIINGISLKVGVAETIALIGHKH
jgi:ABC-type branched-subunit amino acid transport system ATPase component